MMVNPKYKAMLVAKGFKHDEVFFPIFKMTILQSVLTLVAIEDLILYHMDVKMVFL